MKKIEENRAEMEEEALGERDVQEHRFCVRIRVWMR